MSEKFHLDCIQNASINTIIDNSNTGQSTLTSCIDRQCLTPASRDRDSMEMNVYPFSVNAVPSKGGMLFHLETGKDVPFQISRVFFIRDFEPGSVRGQHAHSCLQEILVCVQGDCAVTVEDGLKRMDFNLEHPSEALYIGPMIWIELHDASADCILMALASTPYNPDDCITGHDTFLELARTRRAEGD